MLIKNILKINIFCLGMLLPYISFAGGIDCNKATLDVEKIICSDPALIKQDQQLADIFTQKLSALKNKVDEDGLISDQKVWLMSRNRCKDKACVDSVYKKRISALNPNFYGFEFNGKPINPQCISFFDSSLADEPYIGSILLDECVGSNAASDGEKNRIDDGFLIFDQRSDDDSPAGFYRYRVLGKTDNGVFVVNTQANGGGSLTTQDLLFFKIRDRILFNSAKNENEKELVLVGSYAVPNLCPDSYNITGNKFNFSEVGELNENTWDALVDSCSKSPEKHTFDLSSY